MYYMRMKENGGRFQGNVENYRDENRSTLSVGLLIES